MPSGTSKTWTDAEKAQLLLAILNSKSPSIDWKLVQIPEGRTVKSCMHVIDKLRKTAKEGGEPQEHAASNKSPTAGKNGGGKVAKASKRKMNIENGERAEEDGEMRKESPTKKRFINQNEKTSKNDNVDVDSTIKEGIKEEPKEDD